MFNVNGLEFVVLAVLVLLVVGPERLPQYAQQLANLVRGAVGYAKGAREHLKEEMGPDFEDIDWQKLDPRQYDPRRIVREALTDVWDDEPVSRTARGAAAGGAAGAGAAGAGAAGAAAAKGAVPAERPGEPGPTVRAAASTGPRHRTDDAVGPAPFDPEAT